MALQTHSPIVARSFVQSAYRGRKALSMSQPYRNNTSPCIEMFISCVFLLDRVKLKARRPNLAPHKF